MPFVPQLILNLQEKEGSLMRFAVITIPLRKVVVGKNVSVSIGAPITIGDIQPMNARRSLLQTMNDYMYKLSRAVLLLLALAHNSQELQKNSPYTVP